MKNFTISTKNSKLFSDLSLEMCVELNEKTSKLPQDFLKEVNGKPNIFYNVFCYCLATTCTALLKEGNYSKDFILNSTMNLINQNMENLLENSKEEKL